MLDVDHGFLIVCDKQYMKCYALWYSWFHNIQDVVFVKSKSEI